MVKSLTPRKVTFKTVLSCLAWYLTSSLTAQLSKIILVRFPYPLFLGQCQFLTVSVLALTAILLARRYRAVSSFFPYGTLPSDGSQPLFSRRIFYRVLPLGLLQFTNRCLTLEATSRISVAAVSSIKAMSPLMVVLGYRVVYKVKISPATYLSLVPLVSGVILILVADANYPLANYVKDSLHSSSVGWDHYQIQGMLYCLLSTVAFAAQNMYGKMLFTWRKSGDQNASPASLALNMDEGNTEDDYSSYGEDTKNNTRLPYSVSDLRVGEKTGEIHGSHKRYVDEVVSNGSRWKRAVNNIREAIVGSSSTAEDPIKPDRITIMLYSSLIGSIFSFGGFLANEFFLLVAIVTKKATVQTDHIAADKTGIACLILLDSFSMFSQTLLSNHLLGTVPALTYSVASMMKRVVVIIVSIVVSIGAQTSEDEQNSQGIKHNINSMHFLAILLIAVGLYSYDTRGSRGVRSVSK
ncbi:Piso0_003199 [Millerozyma farinosa CBS 7064]|uniref:Piso0_003199 protein n=1 Tax=Pichia sorbitophila (strain ATCC MYA-4447 / BCRC 22081 / CBS 7064 / NBRC 10061 / NRRL Y-12695) TaxID=559304 RepID=G8YHG4_PICSO|nr:Piso0_003199 [Millerozyma farinosa CBS 7064]CCE80866.1 Piso0_003199 [Millerozyma farinosa CBS 7064]